MAVTGGARVLTGGKHQGAFFQPTVVVDTKDDMQLNCNEVFGPLVTISPYDDFDEAIDRVNKSPWGLQAGVFTRSLALAIKAARKIEVGGLMVNIPNRYRVENQPYGGVKQSGWGREGAKYAIEDMTDMRTVLINP
jgi:acyl-CoA reductase-like NAD-dependent aldehyde dehydrogenase